MQCFSRLVDDEFNKEIETNKHITSNNMINMLCIYFLNTNCSYILGMVDELRNNGLRKWRMVLEILSRVEIHLDFPNVE